MLTRHEKEKEQIKRRALRKEEELLKKQSTEKRNLPKRIRTEMKAREAMFRESMRISISGASDPEIEKNKFKEVCLEFFFDPLILSSNVLFLVPRKRKEAISSRAATI